MPFTYDSIADRVKDDVGSFQFVNRILNDLAYLKQQSEVTVAEDGTVIKKSVSDDIKEEPVSLAFILT